MRPVFPDHLESLAWELSDGGAIPVAFLLDSAEGRKRIFYATQAAAAHEPSSAVTRLIQGIYELDPLKARQIVRSRIFSTLKEPDPMDDGMVRIAAKRISLNVEAIAPEPGLEIFPGWSRIHCDFQVGESGWVLDSCMDPSAPVSPQGSMQLAEKVRLQARRPEEGRARFESDRPIGAVLLSASGRILGAAVNSNATNRTLHAEVNLVQGWWKRNGKPIPAGAKVYVTLKPCKMCLGMIRHACEDFESVEVWYGENDPGPSARYECPQVKRIPMQ